MQITTAGAIAREAARLAFLCNHGGDPASSDFAVDRPIESDSAFEQEKTELLMGIREEILRYGGSYRSGVRLDVCRDVLAHLAGAESLVGTESVTIQ